MSRVVGMTALGQIVYQKVTYDEAAIENCVPEMNGVEVANRHLPLAADSDVLRGKIANDQLLR